MNLKEWERNEVKLKRVLTKEKDLGFVYLLKLLFKWDKTYIFATNTDDEKI